MRVLLRLLKAAHLCHGFQRLQWHSCPSYTKPCQDVAHPRAARGPLAGVSCCWPCARAHAPHGHPVMVTSALSASEMQQVRAGLMADFGRTSATPFPHTQKGLIQPSLLSWLVALQVGPCYGGTTGKGETEPFNTIPHRLLLQKCWVCICLCLLWLSMGLLSETVGRIY